MLLQHLDLDAGTREQQAEDHAGGTAADDHARGSLTRHRHSFPSPYGGGAAPSINLHGEQTCT